jgi:hypothetical protein
MNDNPVQNLSRQEETYKEKKSELLSKLPAQEVADAPFVFSDRQLVTNILTKIDMFRQVLDVQGAIVECGVHKANSLFTYYHLSTILEPYAINRKIIGFDTFEGFPSVSENDPLGKEGYLSDTNFDVIKKMGELHDLNRAVSHVEKLELIKGDANETIPKYVADNPHLIISLLYLDFDIYEPTKQALKYLAPLVPKGGLIGFDEINCKKWQGETIALKEMLDLGTLGLKKFYYDPWVSYYIKD